MLNRQKISRDLNKIQKLWADKGTNTVLRKIFHLTTKKIGQPAIKRTLDRRDLLFKNLEMDTLTQDLVDVLSKGLLRPLGEVRTDVRLIPPEYIESILNEARRILNNEFVIYDNQKVSYEPEQFSWTRDPLTGFVWPKSRLDNPAGIRKPYGTDIKTIWEIARFQFLSPLTYAYILTGEERYARFAADKVNSWIDENPFLHRPHWFTPMESSIRLINWCVYLPLIDFFKYADSSCRNGITQSILEHLIFIRENLEISPSFAGNHYLSNLVGLLLSNLLFPSQNWASENLKFALNEFENEVQSQFEESGINFEGSLPYHRLSSEFFLIGVAIIKKNGLVVPKGIVERLKQTANFTKYYTSASDECPIIGDNDSGICLKFFPRQGLNRHGYLNCLFDVILQNRSEPKSYEEFLCSIHFADTRLPIASDNNKHTKTDRNKLQVGNFDGLILARYRSNAVFFNALQSSQGHSHNDKLSIYPVIGGETLFIDRGSFSYTGFWRKRNEDRWSASHNTPVINNWEQNSIWRGALFYNSGEAKCFSSTDHNGSILTIIGWHVGYERFRKGLKVFRQIHWDIKKRSILIADWVEGITSSEMFLLKLNFLINPIWLTKIADHGFIFTHQQKMVYFEDVDRIGFEPTQSRYSPGYQIEKKCEALTASIQIRAGDKVRFHLRY